VLSLVCDYDDVMEYRMIMNRWSDDKLIDGVMLCKLFWMSRDESIAMHVSTYTCVSTGCDDTLHLRIPTYMMCAMIEDSLRLLLYSFNILIYI
jgi:hypothetical protein